MPFNCCAARSIEHLTVKSQETDQLLIGFSNGKILQLCLDLGHVRQIAAGNYNPLLDFKAFVESRLSVDNKEIISDLVG